MTHPLKGIRVLDVGTLTPGKYCTFILGDLGAEVIRVERPLPPGTTESDRLSDEDLILNRNKKSITLNLRTDEARQVFYQLSKKADVILESHRPGVSKRMGIDYETIEKVNPGIVYCALSGYGQDGPYSQLPGFDIVFMAIGGLLGLIGGHSQPPIVPGLYLSDTASGLLTTIGILTALLAREKTGKGQFVDIAMLDVSFSWLSLAYGIQYPDAGLSPEKGPPAQMSASPGYNIYQTKEGKYIALGIGRPQSWESLCQALGREDFTDHQWTMGEKREEVLSFFKETFRTKTREEWLGLLKGLDIEVGPVNTPEEAFADSQLQHRQMVVEVGPPFKGKMKQIGIPIRFSETPGEVRSTAPLIGQDTQEFLEGMGYSQTQIEELQKAEAI